MFDLNRFKATDKTKGVFTPRETQVLEALAHGLENKQISRLLHISTCTVEKYNNSIYEKLELTDTLINKRVASIMSALGLGFLAIKD